MSALQAVPGTREKHNFGWPVLHKSLLPKCQHERSLLSFNEDAFVDFWIASEADFFIGTSDSSWTNGVSRRRAEATGGGASYLYNCGKIGAGAPLRRTDGGVFPNVFWKKMREKTCRSSKIDYAPQLGVSLRDVQNVVTTD